MNIKICSIENGRDSKDFKQRLPQLMTELNRRNMHVMYAEQVEARRIAKGNYELQQRRG